MWRELAFILNVLFAQEPGEYPEYWQEEIETKTQATEKIDWKYWEPWEFYVAGGSWEVLDDIAIHIKKVYLDSLIDPLPPDDLPGRELRRYYLIVDVSLRALSGNKTINPCGDFAIKDENDKTIWTSDYEGRDVNGYPKLGRRVSMYEKLNPGKLKKGYSNDFYVDDVTVGSAREFAVSRKMVFAIGENNIYGYGRRIRKYMGNNIWLCHGNASVPLINLEKIGLREGYYETKTQENPEELFEKVIDFLGGTGPYGFYNSTLFLTKIKKINQNSLMFYYNEKHKLNDKHKLGLDEYSITPDSFIGVFDDNGNVFKVICFSSDGPHEIKKRIPHY